MPRTTPLLPLAVRRALRQLGRDLQHARRRRRLTAGMVAERAQITRPTLRRVERGDAAVGLGTYATVLWVLGLGERIGELATPATDALGLSMADERLPKRVYPARRRSHLPERTEHLITEHDPLDPDTHKARITRKKTSDKEKRGGEAQ